MESYDGQGFPIWQGRTRMGGWEAQRKCVHCIQGVCCGFCNNFNDSAPSTEVL